MKSVGIFSRCALVTLIVLIALSTGLAQPVPCDQEIVPPDFADGYSRFGEAVALSNDLAVVGAREAGESGQAYVYRFDGSTWNLEQILIPLDALSSYQFGYGVAADGDVIAVGAQLFYGVGACYVFRYDGVSWTEEQKILCPVDQESTGFGRSVALQGDQVLIGAPGVDVGGAEWPEGAAYLFEYDGASWELEHSFASEVPNDWSDFGQSVDFDPASGTVVIGEPDGDTGTLINSGAIHVFESVGGNWSFSQKITADDASQSANLGNSVSLSGDYLLAGANHDGELSMLHGAAYIFERTSGPWLQQEKFLIPGVNIQVGGSVSLSGDTAMVGTVEADPPQVVVYERLGTSWVLEQVLVGQSSPNFGREVHVDGNRAIVGVPESYLGPDSESARIFTRDGADWVFWGFNSHPDDTAACPGEALVLSVDAEGVEPLTYQWQRDGVDIPGQTDATLLIDPMMPEDLATFTVTVSGPCGVMTSQPADVTCRRYQRGDINGNGVVEPLGDAIFLLQYLFGFSASPPCEAAADVDGGGSVQIGDAVYLVTYGFVGGALPPPPFPDCGHDPMHPHGLSCFVPPCP